MKKWITLVGTLVLAFCIAVGVTVFAKEKNTSKVIKVTIKEGNTKKLNFGKHSKQNRKKIRWKSSAPKIVSVSSNGTIRAKRKGKATIIVKYKKKQYKCKITVIAKKGKKSQNVAERSSSPKVKQETKKADSSRVTTGTKTYRGFVIDNVLHSKKNGNIHYNVYIPKSYDGRKKYALYITLPGYQGLYFQGIAANIKTEDFGFEAQKYNKNMIIVAPQLNDWNQTSADQTIALVEYFLEQYQIDSSKVYINGYSGGGETLSLVLGKRPELFAAALMCSSQWDGAYDPIVKAKTPVYFVIGESDEYYGSELFKKAYQTLQDKYEKKGLSENEIKKLLVLDIKGKDYFAGTPVTYQHGGGYLFCRDKNIMGWLFNH